MIAPPRCLLVVGPGRRGRLVAPTMHIIRLIMIFVTSDCIRGRATLTRPFGMPVRRPLRCSSTTRAIAGMITPDLPKGRSMRSIRIMRILSVPKTCYPRRHAIALIGALVLADCQRGPSTMPTLMPPTVGGVRTTPAPSSPATPTPGTSPSPRATATQPPASTSTPTATTSPSLGAFQPIVEVVATGLEVPWALAFAPDGRLFVTERPGRLRVIVDGRLRPTPVATLPVATSAESGLMGLALDPQFARNGYLYVMYTYRTQAGELRNRVARLTVRGDVAGDEQIVLDGIPGGVIHDGGRIAFGPDGKLYVTTGDASNGALAQDRRSLAGKILRINPDGTIPADNPFPGSPVFSYGHRNPEGIAWQPGTGTLFETEHGPVGNDEVNIIQAGQNYGWPDVSGRGGTSRSVDPILVFTPSIAPAGAAFYEGDRLAPWAGNLFFATLRGQHLHRVVLGGPDQRAVIASERLFEGVYGRLRAVAVGPDGYLYVTTSNRDGRGNPAPDDDRILRIVPSASTRR